MNCILIIPCTALFCSVQFKSSGAIAVLQIGFVLTLANLSYLFVFVMHLILCEGCDLVSYFCYFIQLSTFSFPNKDPPGTEEKRRSSPRTYLHVLLDCGLALHLAGFHLLELGAAADTPMDFRSEDEK